MAIERREKQIGANVYVVEQFGAKQGRNVLFRLIKMIGPSFAEMAKADGGDAEGALADALRAFAGTADESDFDALCEAFASKSKVKLEAQFASGPKAVEMDLAKVFDSHFAGNYGEMIGWLVFAAQTNFADFLDGNPLSAMAEAVPKA